MPRFVHAAVVLLLMAGCTQMTSSMSVPLAVDGSLGRIEIYTVPIDPALRLRSATFTPSGKVLVAHYTGDGTNPRALDLAVMDDNGDNVRTFFSATLPERDKDNGVRFMVFPDNRRIFMGDFVLECMPNIDACERSQLFSVEYPEQVADGPHVGHRWSEIIVAPDNEHVAWTTLFADYSAAMFIGKVKKEKDLHRIVDARVISTLNPFRDDPENPDGHLPNPVRNGEVKQFVLGGTAISLVGAKNSDIADSVVQHLNTEEITQITKTPGYDETTIFSPDERLGIVMSSRFSAATDLAVLGLLPRPYPASLNMGLNMFAYTYSVTGVRQARNGNVGPALIEIEASKTQTDYVGINLNTQDEWVFRSPMSWHPNGKKAMWVETLRGSTPMDGQRRIQVVHLPEYEPAAKPAVQTTPEDIPYSVGNLSAIDQFLEQGKNIDVKIYGRKSGYITYRRGINGLIEKAYVNYSDDGESVYSGSETMLLNPGGESAYTASVRLTGPSSGLMDLKITFGSIMAEMPAKIVFSKDDSGTPSSFGFAEYGGKRLVVGDLIP